MLLSGTDKTHFVYNSPSIHAGEQPVLITATYQANKNKISLQPTQILFVPVWKAI